MSAAPALTPPCLVMADGSVTPLTRPVRMEDCRRLIRANTIDVVQLRHLGQPAIVMLVDDEGHFRGLPVNAKATELYHANCHPGTTHQIRGDVAVVHDGEFA